MFQEGVSVPLGNKKNGHGWVTPLDIIPSPSTRSPHLLHGTDRSILCVFVVLPTVPSFFFLTQSTRSGRFPNQVTQNRFKKPRNFTCQISAINDRLNLYTSATSVKFISIISFKVTTV